MIFNEIMSLFVIEIFSSAYPAPYHSLQTSSETLFWGGEILDSDKNFAQGHFMKPYLDLIVPLLHQDSSGDCEPCQWLNIFLLLWQSSNVEVEESRPNDL